jgi:methyl-accepting chemotaxis protein
MQRSLGYTEAMRLEKRGMTRVRNPKGMWEIYEPDVAIDMEPPYGTVLPTTESEMDALCKQSFRDFKSKVPLEDILSERDYILNKTDFNKFRQRFTNFLDNERVKADEKADSLKRGANEADKMSRMSAHEANTTFARSEKLPSHMQSAKGQMLETANQLSKDSAHFDQAAHDNLTMVEKLEAQMVEMQKALNDLKGKE